MVELFDGIITGTRTDAEVTGNLRYISDPHNNGDTVDYVVIWLTLATALWQKSHIEKVPISLTRPLLFAIGDHQTSMYWYEVVYRTKRVAKQQWDAFCMLIDNNQYIPSAHRDEFVAADWTHVKKETAAMAGVLPCVVDVLATFLNGLADKDLNYSAIDAENDLVLVSAILLFAEGVERTKSCTSDEPSHHFIQCEKLLKSVKAPHVKTQVKKVQDACRIVTSLALAAYHMETTKSYSLAVAHLRYFVPDLSPEIKAMRADAQTMLDNTALPQPHASLDTCKQEISLMSRATMDDEPTPKGRNPFETISWTLTQQEKREIHA
jgi:hypothetical protein